jgi:DNA-binding beta-propeller fold protein YncE
VGVDASGVVYVTDEQNRRIAEYTGTGSFIRAFGWGVTTGTSQFEVCTTSCQIGSPDGGAGAVAYPRAVVSDGSTVYVADSNNHRISEFTPGGTFIRAFGWGVATGGAQLEVCTTSCQIGSPGGGAGQLNFPYGVMVDGAGHVYAADRNNNRIGEFTAQGTFIRAFGWGVADGGSAFQVCSLTCQAGLTGAGVGQFNSPEGVATDCRGNLYAADQDNGRIQRFGEPATALPPCPPPPAAAGPTGKRAAALKKCKKKHSKKKRKKCRRRARKLPV